MGKIAQMTDEIIIVEIRKTNLHQCPQSFLRIEIIVMEMDIQKIVIGTATVEYYL